MEDSRSYLWIKVIILTCLMAGFFPRANANLTALYLATDWLRIQQAPDGSWGADQAKFISTSETVTALRASGLYDDSYYQGITWLENHGAPNLDYQSRSIAELSRHGDDVSSALFTINSAQDTVSGNSGGWGVSDQYAGAAIDTALVLQAFDAAAYPGAISNAIQYLKISQGTGNEAGWKASNDGVMDVISTALVVRALAPLEATYPLDIPSMLDNAGAALITHVPTTASTLQIAHTILALHKAGRQSAYVNALVQELIFRQGINGDWESNIYVTSVAVQAMAAVDGIDAANLTSSVTLPDRNLRKTMNLALGKNIMDQIKVADAHRLTNLSISSGVPVSDVTGLGYAVNLKSLSISGTTLTNLGFLVGMTQLESLVLNNDGLFSLSSSDIAGLVNLKTLDLSYQFTSISDLAALANLPSLQTVNLSGNGRLYYEFWLNRADTDGDGAMDLQEYYAFSRCQRASHRDELRPGWPNHRHKRCQWQYHQI